MKKRGITRRAFLAGAGAAGGMLVIGDQLIKVRPRFAPVSGLQDRIRVAVIGLGRQGQLLLKSLLKHQAIEIVALCDVDQIALNKARTLVEVTPGQRPPHLFSDMRRILDDQSVDAVSIATPNHWHALMGIWACQAGKDCYIESPCSHSFFEGRQLVAAAQKYQRIVQYGGLGQINDLSGFDADTLSYLGPIQSIRTICFSSTARARISPPSFKKSRDLDLWLGPARLPKASLAQLNWRKYPQMQNGELGFFALDELHQNLQLLGSKFPAKASTLSSGAASSVARGACIAIQMEFDGNEPAGRRGRLDLEVLPISAMPRETARLVAADNAVAKDSKKGSPLSVVSETTFKGSGGSLTATSRRNAEVECEYLVQNFIAAVRERKQQLLASPIERAHVSCGALHLANISLALKRPISFDPAAQSSINDSQVDELLLGSHRSPFVLPGEI